MPKHANRRDNNEEPLIELAKRLGWTFWQMNDPADWLALRRGVWYVLEIKNPDCEGHADEFTGKQVIFHADVKARGGKVLVWRTEEDVLRDSSSRRSA
jgi:hypothetical protein